jgi:hypothetical protein
MRRIVTLVVVVLALVLPVAVLGPLASAHDADRGTQGLHIGFMGWGELHRGMTPKEAQRTGMVSRQLDRCAPGYPLTRPYQPRGTLVWKTTKKPWKVSEIIVSGPADHTTKGIHPGSTLAALRKAYPLLSKVHDSSFITGQHQVGKQDFHIAFVKRKYGALTFEWDFGPAPKSGTPIDSVIVSRKPSLYVGC